MPERQQHEGAGAAESAAGGAVSAPEAPRGQRAPGWRRLLRAGKPRLSTGNVVAGVLAVGLGFAVATQAHQTQQGGLESLSQTELVGLLDDATERLDRLGEERRQLEASRDDLAEGTDAEAGKAAEERLRSYEVLSGTRAARGSGISMKVEDPQKSVSSDVMLNAVQEMRDAGAEAIQINDVRVVADTWFADSDSGKLSVSGKELSPPYTVVALGDPHTLSVGMRIPGGFTEVVSSLGGEVTVTEGDDLRVDALQQPKKPRYARPVAPTPGG